VGAKLKLNRQLTKELMFFSYKLVSLTGRSKSISINWMQMINIPLPPSKGDFHFGLQTPVFGQVAI